MSVTTIGPPHKASAGLKQRFDAAESAAAADAALQRSAAAAAATDGFFSSSQYTRVFAVGDIHGDIAALLACLKMTGCVQIADDLSVKWVGGPRIAIIVLGDVVDRWRDNARFHKVIYTEQTEGVHHSLGEVPMEEMHVLTLLNNVARAAASQGSLLQRLIGNHELAQTVSLFARDYARQFASPLSVGLNAKESTELVGQQVNGLKAADWRKNVAPNTVAKYEKRTASFQTGQFHTLIGECAPKVVVVVGSHLFVHGGINLRMIEYANRHGRNLVEWANELFATFWRDRHTESEAGSPFDALIFNTSTGMVWDRALSETGLTSGNDACSVTAQAVLAALNLNLAAYGTRQKHTIEHIVVAHCQQYNQFKSNRRIDQVGQQPFYVHALADEIIYSTKGLDPRLPYMAFKTPAVSADFFAGINTLCGGLVWRVDVGMSRGFAQLLANKTQAYKKAFLAATVPQILEIQEDVDVVVDPKQKLVYKVHALKEPLPGVNYVAKVQS
jgi:hypothetical protein